MILGQVAFERGADLIVTGALGHSRAYNFVIGAATHHLAFTRQCAETQVIQDGITCGKPEQNDQAGGDKAEHQTVDKRDQDLRLQTSFRQDRQQPRRRCGGGQNNGPEPRGLPRQQRSQRRRVRVGSVAKFRRACK